MGARTDIYGGEDPQELPLYTATEVAQMLLVPRSTIRTWAFKLKGRDGRFRAPVIEAADPKQRLLSFENLVELHVLSSLRRVHGISLPQIRKTVRYLGTELNTRHPLSSEQMYAYGVDLFVEHLDKLVGASLHGQYALKEIILPYLDRVERDHEKLLRLYPVTSIRETPDLDSPRTIGIDPTMRFGRPYVIECGIETEVFLNRWRAGESIKDMVEDFGISKEAVEEALRYETLAKAA